MKHIKITTISLKNNPSLNEGWVQQVIADDPSILGLGDVVLRDKERRQPRAGRLDLLLQDPETKKRYEVEIQLGSTDESHIIRTIEYWDLEKKRYPQYEHCAVLVAEDFTSRFQNIISLFNGYIPLVAIQMTAIKIEDGVGLNFTKILDEIVWGQVDEDEEIGPTADRDYWLKNGSKENVELVDELLKIIHTFAPDYHLKYNRYYIGLAKGNIVNNFVGCKPKKQWTLIEVRLTDKPELTKEIEDAGVEVEYLAKWGKYKVRLRPGEVEKNSEILEKLFHLAYSENAD